MTRYAAGARFENRVKEALLKDGYLCGRIAGSRGPFDLVALKPSQVLLVQVKRTFSRSEILRRSERVQLVTVARQHGALPILAYQPEPRKPIEFRELTGFGPRDWIDFYPDEIEAAVANGSV